jgi:FMN phosphatase YigB (HAD superfamily)
VNVVKVVCFDVGGVLIRIAHRWAEAARQAGVPTTVDENAIFTDAPFFDPYQSGAIEEEKYFQLLADYLGLNEAALALKVHNHIMLEPYLGVDGLVQELNDAGFLTACLSNTNERHWQDMTGSGRFPANERLGLRMASHEVKLQKPDGAIFRLFETEAQAQGAEIVFFDDTAINIEAAKTLGWNAHLIDPKGDPVSQMRATLQPYLTERATGLNRT